MSSNIFFKKKNINIGKIFQNLKEKKNLIINGIRPLKIAQKNDITFFDSISYLSDVQKTKAKICLTNEKLKKYLPKKLELIIVKNVLELIIWRIIIALKNVEELLETQDNLISCSKHF